MYDTDRGIEELADRRGEDQLAVAWLAERLRDFVDLNPGFETAIDRLASWLARLDDEDEPLRGPFPRTIVGASAVDWCAQPGPGTSLWQPCRWVCVVVATMSLGRWPVRDMS